MHYSHWDPDGLEGDDSAMQGGSSIKTLHWVNQHCFKFVELFS